MTSLSSLSNWSIPLRQAAPPPAVYRAAAAAGGVAGNVAGNAAPSAIVSLSAAGLAAARQAGDDAVAPAPLPMTTAQRFHGLGAAMLDKFATGAAIAVDQQALPGAVDDKFTLSVVTAAGTKVDLVLADVDDEMIVQASADGALGDEERAALAGLARGFQAAIDGMASGGSQVRLDGLAGIDTRLLQSVDFHADVTLPLVAGGGTQSLDFHADGEKRKLGIAGPSGTVDLSIDAGQLESLGTKRQQQKAIDGYLKQFDDAAARGHADAGLMTMFRDAFSSLSHTATGDRLDTAVAPPGRPWSLSKEDHAVLTGLADFSATVRQPPRSSNPLRPGEVDGFRYEVAQQTRSDGARRTDRTVAQVQTARLVAQYHEPLGKDGALRLTPEPDEQNYEYHEIDDSARSSVELGYRDGRLRTATLEQSVSQSERTRKYVMGRMLSDHTVPAAHRLERDLVRALAPYQASDGRSMEEDSREDRETRRQVSLDALGENMFLLGTRLALAERDRQL
ncbi:hypothetical protein [uncultured Massilia sp.]|uniref:hypothetical protein n=1 Tax=uncultured Massilia sp. TaxID=169973 RepID=UPI0025F611AB|nr:hypothetical protein [uncultured Massilia sp.]